MIYHSDEKTGVTVRVGESRDGSPAFYPKTTWITLPRHTKVIAVRDDEADSLLIGLLRWKLEQHKESSAARLMLEQAIADWAEEQSR